MVIGTYPKNEVARIAVIYDVVKNGLLYLRDNKEDMLERDDLVGRLNGMARRIQELRVLCDEEISRELLVETLGQNLEDFIDFYLEEGKVAKDKRYQNFSYPVFRRA